jgi:DNA replication licensing factor MCM5
LKATRLMLQCRECNSTKRVVVKPGIAGVAIPRYCDAAQNMPGSEGCGSDPFHIVADGSEYVDQQQLKLQVLTFTAVHVGLCRQG